MLLSTGVTCGGVGGSLVGGTGGMGLCVGIGGFLVGMEGFHTGTDGLRGGGDTLFGGSLVVVVVVVMAAVGLGIMGKILFGVTGGRTVVVVLF